MTDEQFESLREDFHEMAEAMTVLSEKESYDKELGKSIQESFSKVAEQFAKIKPVDLKPVINIAADISKQNGSIMDMVGRLIHSQDNSGLITMITEMVKRNNEFVSQVIQQKDYSNALGLIATNLKHDKIDRLKPVRDRSGLIEFVDVIYKKSS